MIARRSHAVAWRWDGCQSRNIPLPCFCFCNRWRIFQGSLNYTDVFFARPTLTREFIALVLLRGCEWLPLNDLFLPLLDTMLAVAEQSILAVFIGAKAPFRSSVLIGLTLYEDILSLQYHYHPSWIAVFNVSSPRTMWLRNALSSGLRWHSTSAKVLSRTTQSWLRIF